jgi:hypothetical protein
VNEDGGRGLLFLILSIFAFISIIAAVRGDYLLSGVSALYFTGYFLVRIAGFFEDALMQIPEKVWGTPPAARCVMDARRVTADVIASGGACTLLLVPIYHTEPAVGEFIETNILPTRLFLCAY